MSALPPKADVAERDHHVRFVPKADIGHSFSSAVPLVCKDYERCCQPSDVRGTCAQCSSYNIGAVRPARWRANGLRLSPSHSSWRPLGFCHRP